MVARWACLPFSVFGAWICLRWAQFLFGNTAGLTALAFWCFSPHILGHGATIMPDVPAAALGVAAVYCFWRWLKQPGWFEVLVAGTGLGLAELCKFTLLIFYPLLPVLWIVYRLPEWRRGTIARRGWLRQSGMMAAMLLLSVYIINCGYLFEGSLTPLERFRFQSTMFAGGESLNDVPPEGANRLAGTWLGKVPVPLPANMLQGIDTQRYDFERGLPSYLRGTWQDRGWWYYYLYALAVKVPLGTWCLAGWAVGVTLVDIFGRKRNVDSPPPSPPAPLPEGEGSSYSAPWRDEMVVLAPGLAILVFVSSQTGFSHHSRYVLPALPFFFIWISKVGRAVERKRGKEERRNDGRGRVDFSRVVATPLVVALTWSVGSSLWVYPHSLSYFNELAGGPRRGGEHLLNSNIDWGQDLLYLKRWLDDHPGVTLDGLAYYGSYGPELAGIPETARPPVEEADDTRGPRPGWYALSVNYLYDRSQRYRYFLDFEPIASAGYSIYIYRVTPKEANRMRHERGLPELAVEPVAMKTLAGEPYRGEWGKRIPPDDPL
ncbi:MAG: glycosyltransferase family 39 protein [Pirellulales bacterium]|nr:glycosyltransferase family 39 protein [Pirellulales bacterium]